VSEGTDEYESTGIPVLDRLGDGVCTALWDCYQLGIRTGTMNANQLHLLANL
jgi:hypothetical protein